MAVPATLHSSVCPALVPSLSWRANPSRGIAPCASFGQLCNGVNSAAGNAQGDSSLARNGSLRGVAHDRRRWRQIGVKFQARVASEMEVELLQKAKFSLLREVQETDRGLKVDAERRACIEEAMVAVECYHADSSLDLNDLDGTWMLQYTTAPDVLSILQAAKLPVFKVGQIFQKFDCSDSFNGGVVRNIVRWSLPGLLQEHDGATLTVTAKFSVFTSRNIVLQFEEAAVGSLLISDELQALLAPAFLPRSFLNLEVLQFFRQFNARIPLQRGGSISNTYNRASIGLLYYLSFLDKDMLLGRALGSGGIFIFSRTQPLQIF